MLPTRLTAPAIFACSHAVVAKVSNQFFLHVAKLSHFAHNLECFPLGSYFLVQDETITRRHCETTLINGNL